MSRSISDALEAPPAGPEEAKPLANGSSSRRRPTATWRRLLLPAVVMVATTFALMPLALLGQRTYAAVDLNALGSPYRDTATRPEIANPVQTDQVEVLPWTAAFYRDIRRGEWPKWSPNIAGGVPTGILSIYQILSPFSLAYLVLPAWYAATLAVALSLLMAQLATYLLCRRLGLGVGAATLAGVAYAFNGTNMVFLHRVSAVALAPALLWAGHRLMSKPTAARAVLTAALLSWAWHEGFPAAFVFSAYALIVWASWLIIRGAWARGGWRDRLRVAGPQIAALTAAGVLAVLLSAVTLVGSLQQVLSRGYLDLGQRQYDSSAHLSQASFFGMFDLSATGDLYGRSIGIANTVEGISLVGSIALLAAGLTLLGVAVGRIRLPRRLNDVWPLLALGFAGMIVLTFIGTPLLGLVYKVPGLSNNLFTRARYFIALGAAILGATGLHVLWESRTKAAATDASKHDRPVLPDRLARWASGLAIAAICGATIVCANDFRAAVRTAGAGSSVVRGVAIAATFAIAAVVAAVFGRRLGRRPIAVVALAALLFVQLGWPLRDYTPQAPVHLFYGQTEGQKVLQGLTRDAYRFSGSGLITYYPNATLLNGLYDLRGASLQDADFVRLLREAAPRAFERDPFKVIPIVGEVDFGSPVLDHLALRYFVLSTNEIPLGDVQPPPAAAPTWHPAAASRAPLQAPGPIAGAIVLIRNDRECHEGFARVRLESGGRVIDEAQRPLYEIGAGAVSFALTGQQIPSGDDVVLAVDGPAGCPLSVGAVDAKAGGYTPALQWITEPADSPLRLVATDQGWFYERPTAWPLVSAHLSWSSLPTAEAAAKAATTSRGAVPIVDGPASGSFEGTAKVDNFELRGNRARAVVHADKGALVVVSMNESPGWSARVNGHKAEIVKVDGALLGVFVGEGTSTIEMTYAPESFTLGALTTLTGLLICVLVLLYEVRRRRGLPMVVRWRSGSARRDRATTQELVVPQP